MGQAVNTLNWPYSVRCIKGNTPPSVATGNVNSYGANTATVGGNVYTTGGDDISEVGICYSTSNNPTTANSKVTATAATGSFTATLTGLNVGTTYYYRAYATNANGTQYGEVKSFTTKKYATVALAGYGGIGTTSMTLYATITPNDATVTNWAFRLCKRNADGTYPTTYITKSNTNVNVQSGQYHINITGLEAGATYKCQAAIYQNIDGASATWVYSPSTITITLGSAPSSITTVGATLFTFNSNGTINYRLEGNLGNAGNPIATKKFIYSTSSNPTLQNGTVIEGYSASSGDGYNIYNFVDFTSGTTYYYRVCAYNSYDTIYGSVKTLTPPSGKPTVNVRRVNWFTYTPRVTRNSIMATFHGNTNGNTITEFGVVYMPKTGAGAPSLTQLQIGFTGVTSVAGSGSYSSNKVVNLTGLTPNTAYYMRSYCKVGNAVVYGDSLVIINTQLQCGETLRDQDNYSYETVLVTVNDFGDPYSRCWMKSNLKATKYDSWYGPSVPAGSSASQSDTTASSGKWFGSNISTYGRLYNWVAATGWGVNDPYNLNHTMLVGGLSPTDANSSSDHVQGLCPRGWHVPNVLDVQNLNHWLNASPSNKTAFAVQAAGVYGVGTSGIGDIGSYMYLMCVSGNNMTNTQLMSYLKVSSNGTSAYWGPYYPLGNAMSIRCVQDIDY
ncbi:MAG: hypothetical protein IKU03_01860 [Bacteroidales bacterium]|nr:hypothetical protein [Bacteroidales bacterium]